MSISRDQVMAQRFDAVLAHIDDWIRPNGVPGVGVAVWHGGELVAERYAGIARGADTVNANTLFALASVSKPISAAAVMSAIAEGQFSLDDRVMDLLPEFDAGDDVAAVPVLETMRPAITVRHLMAHTSGLPEDIASRKMRYSDGPTLAALTDALCRLPLQTAPGEVLRYSNAGYAALARLTERLGGMEFWERVRRRVLSPTGIDAIVARPGPELTARIASVRDAANPGTALESYNSPYWRNLAIPWGGYYGTPRALAQFAATFLPSWSGPSPLSPGTITEMTSDQAGGIPGGVESGRVSWPIASWGLGWEIKCEKQRHWTGTVTSAATFCHFGQAGTLLWADPARDLVLAVFTNRTVTRAWTFFLGSWSKLSDAVASVVAP